LANKKRGKCNVEKRLFRELFGFKKLKALFHYLQAKQPNSTLLIKNKKEMEKKIHLRI